MLRAEILEYVHVCVLVAMVFILFGINIENVSLVVAWIIFAVVLFLYVSILHGANY